jgi:hypothetical protein
MPEAYAALTNTMELEALIEVDAINLAIMLHSEIVKASQEQKRPTK